MVWEGKYDEFGNRRPVRLPEIPLPLQKIETVDAPRDAAKALATRQGDLFDQEKFSKSSHRDDFRNMLVWGDNKLALKALLDGDSTRGVSPFRGKVDLIYIDPPFDVGADFTIDVQIGNDDEKRRKEQSVIESVAYSDTWGKGTDSYLQMVFERMKVAQDLLSDRGSVLLHCDWRMNFYLRSMLNEILDKKSFRNELIWFYPDSPGRPYDRFPPKHDTIYWFTRSESSIFDPDPVRVPILEASKKRYEKPRILINSQGVPYEYVGGKAAEIGKVPETVWQIPVVKGTTDEDYGYDNQKPEALLRRIVLACSELNSIVLDFFCGSGTTCAVAEKLGRKWIGVDLGRYAIHTTRKRLIQVQRELHTKGEPYRSFDVYNLGRYERQWWQLDRLRGADEEHRKTVLRFFKAQPLDNPPSALLHAARGGAFVHVDEIDSLFGYEELREIAKAAADASGSLNVVDGVSKRGRLIVLAWEFEMDLRKRAAGVEAEFNLEVQLKYIPREIMEPNRDTLQFFDAGAVEAEPIVTTKDGKTTVDVKLTGFYPSLTEVPDKELELLRERAVKSPFDFIDFWAVDFLHEDGKPFEHHWQDFRTRKDRRLATQSTCEWHYDSPGRKRICVKVIDVFGIDTTKVIEVDV